MPSGEAHVVGIDFAECGQQHHEKHCRHQKFGCLLGFGLDWRQLRYIVECHKSHHAACHADRQGPVFKKSYECIYIVDVLFFVCKIILFDCFCLYIKYRLMHQFGRTALQTKRCEPISQNLLPILQNGLQN